ncbi:hypothetical protein L2K70_19300 [Nocardioides KLBMP 9356]|uniref:VCBS repeat-containing protein n=1 Tax=Nocardioides potassii TaxID=2911371 RepID=A0ABS9HGS2_9ACTN|nr:hypothetical protein [Nocardioides potassii]MCF6379764.1 hypothetical protein [Nocardioides potassii]
MSTDIEARLRDALAARADLVRHEDLTPLATVVPLRPRWQSPWVLLATAAAVLLVLGIVVQGVGGRERSDRIAPQPDGPTLEMPADVGRDWKADDLSRPARVDLDGDGVREKVQFLSEKTDDYAGRVRLQTTLSSTGEESWGIAELTSTIGVTARGAIDADGDGDEELVLPWEDLAAVGGAGHPLVFDLRDGLLVEMLAADPDLLQSGDVAVPGSQTEFYDLVHEQDWWIKGGQVWSSRSVNAFARGNMTLLRPESIVLDTWRWELGDDGVLRPTDQGCAEDSTVEGRHDCDGDQADSLPAVQPAATDTIGIGGEVALDDGGLGYRARVEDDGSGGTLVVDGPGADGLVYALSAPDPRVSTVSPTYLVGFDAASVYVASAADPAVAEVVAQTADLAGLVALRPVGDVPLGTGSDSDGRAYRTWLTKAGAVVTVVEAEDGSWDSWQWARVGGTDIAALPTGRVCFADVTDPSSVARC